MKKPLILSLAALAMASMANAEALSPSQALSRALNSQNGAKKVQSYVGKNAMKLVHSGADLQRSNSSAYYVFEPNNGEGFLIVSGDSRMRPVLAKSDAGEFPLADMPENMKYWLSTYEAEASGLADDATAATDADSNDEWTPIEPLIKTHWDQTEPYNKACPTYNGNTCPTGCVATAMAQIVKHIGYYNGKGSFSYNLANLGNYTVSFNFAKWTPDFSKMLNEYVAGSYTDEQLNEVADLMLACGVAVNTGYKTTSSGAVEPISGLVQYFGYSSESKWLERRAFTSQAWEALIYDQLSQNRPVFYDGTGDGGHAFVCDGYSSDGLFHFNWGWRGAGDGYFALSALEPEVQGAGASKGGYNMSQHIGIFVTPDDAKPVIPEAQNPYNMVFGQALALPTIKNSKDTFKYMWTIYSSATTDNARLAMTLLLKSVDGSVADILIAPKSYSTVYVRQVMGNFTVDFSGVDVPAGKYLAFPVCCERGREGYQFLQPNGVQPINDHYELTVSESGERTYKLAEAVSPYVKAVNISTNDLYAGDGENTLTYTLINGGDVDFMEKISIRYTDASGNQKTLANKYISVPAGGRIDRTESLRGISTAGKYTLSFHRENYAGAHLCTNTYDFSVASGKRPGAGKGVSPAGIAEVGLWNGSTGERKSRISMAAGGTISGTTAFLPTSTGTFTYELRICKGEDFYNPIFTQQIGANKSASGSDWVMGDQFSVKPDLAPGTYNMIFSDPWGTIMSYPFELVVGIEQDGLLYQVDDNNVATLTACTTEIKGAVTIPAKLTLNGKEYAVTSIASEAFVGQKGLTALIIPAAITAIGVDAFKGCTALQTVEFEGKTAPFENSMLVFVGVNNAAFYVPADAYAKFHEVFTSVNHGLYCHVTSFSAPATAGVKVGGSVVIRLDAKPMSKFNPAIMSVVSDNDVVATAAINADGNVAVSGVAAGNAKLTVTCSELPGVAATIDVTVSEKSGNDNKDPETPELENFTVPETLTLAVGEWLAVPVTFKPENAAVELLWTSFDESVVTVSKEGKLNGIKPGTAIVEVKSPDKSIEHKISVTVTEQSSISEIEGPASDAVIYDLQGHRVSNPRRGLYIVNGKKTLLK